MGCVALAPCNVCDAIVPEEDRQAGRECRRAGTGVGRDWWAVCVWWQAGSGGGQGSLAGRVGWLALPGRVVGETSE